MNEDSEIEPTRQSLRQRLREATSREILAAAEEVFADLGLERASMAQIAERAGVAVGTLYNRFKDREALLEALLLERRSDLLAKLDAEIETVRDAGFREQLEGFFRTLFDHFQEHRAFFRLVFTRVVGKQEKREQMSRAVLERLNRILSLGRSEGLLRDDPDGWLTVFLMSAAKGVLQREHYGLPPADPANAAGELVRLFIEGART